MRVLHARNTCERRLDPHGALPPITDSADRPPSPRQDHLPLPPINERITDQETVPGVHLAVSTTYQQITKPLQLIN